MKVITPDSEQHFFQTEQIDSQGIYSEDVEIEKEKREFILAQIESSVLVIPSKMISEVLIIERSQILTLPFYVSEILGCLHHEGDIVPLVSGSHVLNLRSEGLIKPVVTVLRLSEAMGEIAGVGIVVAQIIGSKTQSQLPAEIFSEDQDSAQHNSRHNMKLFAVELISPQIWQTRHWSMETLV